MVFSVHLHHARPIGSRFALSRLVHSFGGFGLGILSYFVEFEDVVIELSSLTVRVLCAKSPESIDCFWPSANLLFTTLACFGGMASFPMVEARDIYLSSI